MQLNICLVPRLTGIGGMVSFQSKFVEGLKRRGIEVSFDPLDHAVNSILVIGGTRHIGQLWRAKGRGVRIVQRLDGMNWIHRVTRTGPGHWVRAEYGNLILTFIRSYLAEKIAYQSRFSQDWWEREKGDFAKPSAVIYNGVDLQVFTPSETPIHEGEVLQILMVEGSLLGGYEFGLENAVKLASQVAQKLAPTRQVELIVVGKVSNITRQRWDNWLAQRTGKNKVSVKWLGAVAHDRIFEIYQQADFLFSADINAACPNSVIEAIACGTPVLAYHTGALAEILEENAGVVVPYGGNPWNLDQPDIPSLVSGAMQITRNLASYRKSARQRAEKAFSLDDMVDQYVELLLS